MSLFFFFFQPNDYCHHQDNSICFSLSQSISWTTLTIIFIIDATFCQHLGGRRKEDKELADVLESKEQFKHKGRNLYK